MLAGRLWPVLALALSGFVALVSALVDAGAQQAVNRGPLPSRPWPPSEATVSEIQRLLYDINGAISAIDGQLNPETVEAVQAWQRQFGFEPDGRLTEAQLARLRQSLPPQQWGAMAYAGSKEIIVAWDKPARAQAEREVMLACQALAAGDCRVIAVAASQCVAAAGFRLALGAGGEGWSEPFVARYAGLANAQILALSNCGRDSRSRGRCEIIGKVCPDGSHASAPAAR